MAALQQEFKAKEAEVNGKGARWLHTTLYTLFQGSLNVKHRPPSPVTRSPRGFPPLKKPSPLLRKMQADHRRQVLSSLLRDAEATPPTPPTPPTSLLALLLPRT